MTLASSLGGTQKGWAAIAALHAAQECPHSSHKTPENRRHEAKPAQGQPEGSADKNPCHIYVSRTWQELLGGGRYWDRTSDLCRVKANRVSAGGGPEPRFSCLAWPFPAQDISPSRADWQGFAHRNGVPQAMRPPHRHKPESSIQSCRIRGDPYKAKSSRW